MTALEPLIRIAEGTTEPLRASRPTEGDRCHLKSHVSDRKGNGHHNRQHDNEQDDKEDPVGGSRSPSPCRVAPQEAIIALVRFEPGGEEVTGAGKRAEEGIDKNVDRHANKHHTRDARAETMNEDQRGEGRCGSVAKAGYQPDDGIEAHAVLCSRNREEIIQDVSEQTGKLVSPIGGGRKHLHLDFSKVLFHQAIDRMVAPAFKRLCCFPAASFRLTTIAVKGTLGAAWAAGKGGYSPRSSSPEKGACEERRSRDGSCTEQSDSGELETISKDWEGRNRGVSTGRRSTHAGAPHPHAL
jgi:hypothetical protein